AGIPHAVAVEVVELGAGLGRLLEVGEVVAGADLAFGQGHGIAELPLGGVEAVVAVGRARLGDRVGAGVGGERVVTGGVGRGRDVDGVALAVGAVEVDPPACEARLAGIAHAVAIEVVELGAGLRRLLEVGEIVAGADLVFDQGHGIAELPLGGVEAGV